MRRDFLRMSAVPFANPVNRYHLLPLRSVSGLLLDVIGYFLKLAIGIPGEDSQIVIFAKFSFNGTRETDHRIPQSDGPRKERPMDSFHL
jgi:hypothetical protein